jgi:hypothetical protein
VTRPRITSRLSSGNCPTSSSTERAVQNAFDLLYSGREAKSSALSPFAGTLYTWGYQPVASDSIGAALDAHLLEYPDVVRDCKGVAGVLVREKVVVIIES